MTTILITGASRGIGAALAARALARGASVIAVARGFDGPAERGVTRVCADITTASGRDAVARAAAAGIDVLVNNAGTQTALDLTAISPQALGEIAEPEIAVNLTAPLLLTTALLPVLRPGGKVVNVTSLLSRHPKPSAPVYSAAKAGLASLTRSMRLNFASRGIAVVEVVPPLVDTEMTAGRGSGKMSAEAMALAILDGLARGKTTIAPGASAPLLWIDRLAPALAARLLARG